MERREALKKLAIGGAVGMTASSVVSTRAFAYDLPSNPTGISILTQTITTQRLDIESVSFGTAMCPASANVTAVSGVFQQWDAAISSISGPGNAVVQLRAYNGGPVFGLLPFSHFDPLGFRLRKRFANGAGDPPWQPGDSFNVNLTVRFTCTYSDGTTRDLDEVISYRITKGANPPSAQNWNVVQL